MFGFRIGRGQRCQVLRSDSIWYPNQILQLDSSVVLPFFTFCLKFEMVLLKAGSSKGSTGISVYHY